MANTEKITDVKQWLKLFNSSSLYKHEPSRMLDDYLTLTLCAVANQQQEERYLAVAKRYSREEMNVFAQLFAYHVLIHEHQVAERGWYDMLGDVYMDLAGRSRTSRMGQFFTPVEVCSLMARMTMGDDPEPGQTATDPAAGSGRMLLAMHALQPKMGLITAVDLDPTCAKMCALNFWLHGIRGEVAHMNSLSLDWCCAWQTHPRATWPFVTWLDDSRKEESLMYLDREQIRKAARQPEPPKAPDLFSELQEPPAVYDADSPFRPCDLCGCTGSDTCVLVADEALEPWTLTSGEEPQFRCTACGSALQGVERMDEPDTL